MIALRARHLLGVPVFALAFGGAYAATAPSAGDQARRAVLAVAGDPANTVCLGKAPCIDPAAKRTLLVFFSPRDCPGGLYLTAALEEVYRALPRGAVNVVGVVEGLDHDRAERFAQASEISYPLYLAPERVERFVANPRPEDTNRPVALLIGADGEVEATVTAGATVESVRRAAGDLRRRAVAP